MRGDCNTPAHARAHTRADLCTCWAYTRQSQRARTLVVYADFQCPYSRQFAHQVLPRLMNDYIVPGKISFTYKYFPVIDDGRVGESHWAAQAAECASEQKRFWEYHDKLYAE